ncbi:MAG: hypothetical protein ACRDQ7_20605 [Haloechinothrix sp.]
MAAANPDEYLDVRLCLAHPAYWVNAVAYSIIAEQADLLPDDQVADISAAALNILDEARNGTLQDSPLLSPSVKLNAVKVLASLAERMPQEHARRLLEHMQPWVPREPNHYRHTDDDHVRACVGIATTNSDLRAEAIDQLMGLLDAADSGVSARVEREARELVQEHPDLVRDQLVPMTARGNRHAAQLLRAISDAPSAEEQASAAEAAARLRTPLPAPRSRSTSALALRTMRNFRCHWTPQSGASWRIYSWNTPGHHTNRPPTKPSTTVRPGSSPMILTMSTRSSKKPSSWLLTGPARSETSRSGSTLTR